MASMYCWPSVSIKRGVSLVIARKIVKAEFEWTFGYLLIVIDSSFSNEQVACVITSKNAQFIDPVHKVSLDSPVELCQQYGHNVCYYLMPQQTESRMQRRNAFEILMQSSKERKRPKKAHSSGTIKL